MQLQSGLFESMRGMGCFHSHKSSVYAEERKFRAAVLGPTPNRENRPEITEAHMRIIRETWKVIKLDITKTGIVMFIR